MTEKEDKVKTNITKAWAQHLRSGATLLHPTDTIWGLASAAFSKKGVDKIYNIKQKPAHDPLILLVSDLNMLQRFITKIPPRIETLLDYVERPLTLIYPKVKLLPESLIHKDGTVAFRIVPKTETADLIKMINQPLVSTSANLNGRSYAKSYFDIDESIKEKVDYIYYPPNELKLEYNQPSVIAKFDRNGELDFIRT